MKRELPPVLVRRWLNTVGKCPSLGRRDQALLVRLLPAFKNSTRLSVGAALARLFPKVGRKNANTYLRRLRKRVNRAAKENGAQLRMKTSPGKRDAAKNRWLWFEGTAEALVHDDDRRVVHIFVCWTRMNRNNEQRLMQLLNPRLANSRIAKFEIWQDREIPVGAHWQKEIRDHLNLADIGLILLTDEILRIDYVRDIELPVLLEKTVVAACLESIDAERIDLRGLERRQLFRDRDGKAFGERSRNRARKWAQELARKIEDIA